MTQESFKTSQEDSAVALVNLLTHAITNAFHLEEQAATPLAQHIADSLFCIARGEKLYIPKLDRRRRNAAIRMEFNGRNAAEICARYGICRAQLYRILANDA